MSLSVKSGSNMQESKIQKCKNQSRKNNSMKLFVSWKGVSKMTIVFAAFMVSKGIPGRDSMMCG